LNRKDLFERHDGSYISAKSSGTSIRRFRKLFTVRAALRRMKHHRSAYNTMFNSTGI